TLTDLTAEAAWNEFREIEAEDGIIASLKTGALQSRVMDARLERQRRLEDGKTVVIGASLYPLESERDHAILAADRSDLAASDGEMRCKPLRPHRLSETSEASR
ncbi:MAG: methylmalonyl-CoA mutase family protein, partial [Aurantimonas coralicida]|nr:methylmalonyl-CoA mutase family protein [Aurantimonas coralicida]